MFYNVKSLNASFMILFPDNFREQFREVHVTPYWNSVRVYCKAKEDTPFQMLRCLLRAIRANNKEPNRKAFEISLKIRVTFLPEKALCLVPHYSPVTMEPGINRDVHESFLPRESEPPFVGIATLLQFCSYQSTTVNTKFKSQLYHSPVR